jgi:hypothetical protein
MHSRAIKSAAATTKAATTARISAIKSAAASLVSKTSPAIKIFHNIYNL